MRAARRLRAPSFGAVSVALALGACGKIEELGLDEPIRVTTAAYTAGPLPGSDFDADAGTPPVAPLVTSVESPSAIIALGAQGRSFLGRTTPDAYAVAVALGDEGRAHWLQPVGAPDPTVMGERTFTMGIDFASDLAPGLYALRFVAIDGAGRGGTRTEFPICVVPDYPDGLNACDPQLAVPAALVTLTWDTQADVDLLLVTPEGALVSGKSPTTTPDDGIVPPERLADPRTGVFLRDSNGACVIDGQRRESVLWREAPEPGLYLAYASLFDTCGEPIAHFTLTVWRRTTADDGTTRLVAETVKRGSLLPLEASGGRTRGTYVGAIAFP
jgi:hypothetical protein